MHLQHHSSIMLGPLSGYTKHDKLVVHANILRLLPWEGGNGHTCGNSQIFEEVWTPLFINKKIK